jgi:GT2 family glycosyltransferase
MDDISVIATVYEEPAERLRRLLTSLAAQEDVGSVELVLESPMRDGDRLGLAPSGAVTKIVMVDNPSGQRSPGLNRAIAATSRPIVCRVDARSILHPDHLARCRARLVADSDVGIVGGVQLPVPGNRGIVARGIARALANAWLLGGAKYRRRGAAGSADTVYLGCFRRGEVEALGGYDERLEANEDFDLAKRYRQAGRVIWVEDGLEVPYESRTSWQALFSQYEAFGVAKVRYWRLRNERPNLRQALALVLGLTAALAALLGGPRRAATAAACGGLGLVVVDHFAAPAERDLLVRLASVVSTALLIAGWLSGIVRELSRPASSTPRSST